MRWHVKKRPVGFRPRVRAMPSVAGAPNERWATDLCRVWSGPERNGMVERLIRTLKEQCVHRHRFETLQHASRAISDWIGFYNTR